LKRAIPALMYSIMVVSLLLLTGCHVRDRNGLKVTGQIEATTVDVGSRVGGRVAEVLVAEGDSVLSGDVLIRLEDDEVQAAVDVARAQLAQATATLAKLEAGARPEQIRQAEAAAKQAEEQYRAAQRGSRSQEVLASAAAADAAKAARDEARTEFTRAERLLASNAVAQQAYDRAKHALDAAQAQFDAAQQKLDLVTEGLRSEEIAMAKAGYDRAAAMLDEIRNGARIEDLDAARAARDAAAANLARAEVAAREMVVTAPRDGVVESLDLHPGDLVKPGACATLVDPEDLKLVVYVSSTVLGRLQIGEKVGLTTDSHGAETFDGVITWIGSKGEFTPRNLQTTEERAQQVFGIKIATDSAGGRLRAGMAATAHLTAEGHGR